jgi:hypothetical protein
MTMTALAWGATCAGGADAADGACVHGKVVDEMFA